MKFMINRKLSYYILLLAVIDVETSEECGKMINGVQGRIINGTKAANGEFIWMVHVLANGMACGGTIITSKWIMSAAHCLKKVKKGDVSNVMFVVEQWGIPLKNTSLSQRKKVSQALRHPNWNALTLINDIALLEAETPLALNNIRIGRVCLPVIDIPLNSQTKVTVTGWGSREAKPLIMSPDLMKVDLKIIPLNECKKLYGKKDLGQYIKATNICTRLEGKDSCQGDSGGPLFTPVNGRYVQVGIVSAGVSCADFEYPGFFTKVSMYIDWIKTVTQSKLDYEHLLNPIHSTTENSTTKSSCPDQFKNIRIVINLILLLYVFFS